MTATLQEPTGLAAVDLERVDGAIERALTQSIPEVERGDRRTRNRLRTKGVILRAAWRLFLTTGYDRTTVQDITEAADIGKGTFFSHFAKKSDVALYFCNHRREVILGLYRMGAFGEGSASNRIERMMVNFAELNGDEEPVARLMTEIVLRQFFADPAFMGPDRPSIEVALEDLLQSGVAAGEFSPHCDCASGARLIHAAFYSAKAEWLRPGPYEVRFDLATRVRDDIHVVLRGLRA